MIFGLQSGVNGSTSTFPDATGRAFTTAFSAQLGSSAADMNHTDAIGAFKFPIFTPSILTGFLYTHFGKKTY